MSPWVVERGQWEHVCHQAWKIEYQYSLLQLVLESVLEKSYGDVYAGMLVR
jgi:hypothetical protein